jgi:hypothetical protein
MQTRSEARRARAKEHAGREEQFEREKAKRDWEIDVPNDPVNEQVVLAAMLADDELRARLVKLPPDAFYAKEHRAVFLGLQALEQKKLAYDPAVVARLNPDADIRVLETLMATRPDAPPNIDFHVDTLRWDHHRASVAQGPLASFLEALQNPKETPDRQRALARAIHEAFNQTVGASAFLRKPGEVVAEMMKRVRERIEGEPIYPFGIKGLDNWEAGKTNDKGEDIGGTPRIIPGAAPGLATMLTAMSGSGKSTLAAHAIIGLARQRRRLAVGAWEVRAPMTLELLTTMSLGWSRIRMLTGKSNELGPAEPMTPGELVAFEEQAHKISRIVTFIENPFRRGSVAKVGRTSNDDYLDILEEHLEMSGCEVAVFDLFDRVLRDRTPNDEQEALWRMLEFTERLQIHSVIVHQQNMKGDEVRKDMKPHIQGLKGSTAYVDAAALILAPHLPARWKNVPDDTLELYGLKQRFGPPFAVEFDWDPDTGQITRGRTMEGDSREGESDEAEAFGAPRKRDANGYGKKGKRR